MENLKQLFIALIMVIVGKMAELKQSVSNSINTVSLELDSFKNLVDQKLSAIGSRIDTVSSSLESYKTEVSNLLSSLKSELTSYIQSEVASLVQKIGEDDGRLQELVDDVTALAQADQGLVSAAGAQSFSEDQKITARENIGAVSMQMLQMVNQDLNYFNNSLTERINNIEANSVDYEALKNELVDFINSEFSARGL